MPPPTFDQSTTWPSGFLDTMEPAPLPPPLMPAPDPFDRAPGVRPGTGRWWLDALLLLVVVPVGLVAAVAALPVTVLVLAFERLHHRLRRRGAQEDADGRDD